MNIEIRRVVVRPSVDRTIVDDNTQGLFLADSNLNLIEKLGFEDYDLLDYSRNGRILLLNSKKWLTRKNANKTILKGIDLETKNELFSTESFLAYRGIIDGTSGYCLVEYYNGLCAVEMQTGKIVFQKDRIDKSLHNADLLAKENIAYIPTGKKSLLAFDFNAQKLIEIKMNKVAATTWVKFDNAQSHLLVSDKKNSVHCFRYSDLKNPIWTIDFSKFKPYDRIWCYPMLTTASGLGCIHGFTPTNSQNPTSGGILYVFRLANGEIIDQIEYSIINQKIITDYREDQILIDNLTAFSLTQKTIYGTPFFEILKQST